MARRKRVKKIGPLTKQATIVIKNRNKRKRVKRALKRKGGKTGTSSLVSENRVVPYNAPDVSGGNQMQQRLNTGGGNDDVEHNTRVNVLGLLSPYEALLMGVKPKVSDNTFRPTFAFTSRYKTTVTTVANATAGTSDVYIRVSPTGVGHVSVATAFTSQIYPTAFTVVNDPTYSTWSSFVDEFRMVGCEIKLRNTGKVANLNGVAAIGRVGNNDSPDVAHTGWANFADSGDVTTHTAGKPGDVFKTIFMPLVSNSTHDWQFYPPSTAAAGEDTSLVFWAQGDASTTITFDLEVYTHWEVLVTSGQDQTYTPSTAVSDQSLSNRLVAKALGALPLLDQLRAVETDDGEILSAISDVKTLWGAGKRLVAGASKAWSWVKGLFDVRRGEAGLLAAIDQGLTFAMLDDWNKLIRKFDPPTEASVRKYLADRVEVERKHIAFEKATGMTVTQARELIMVPKAVALGGDTLLGDSPVYVNYGHSDEKSASSVKRPTALRTAA